MGKKHMPSHDDPFSKALLTLANKSINDAFNNTRQDFTPRSSVGAI